MTDRYLLDTCLIIWFATGATLSRQASVVINREGDNSDRLFVCSMSAWEIGMLISKKRLPSRKSAMSWFQDAVDSIGAKVIDPPLAALIEASFLPEPVHNDPTNRIFIATARENDLTIITRDRAILSYGEAGHVRTLAC